MKKMNRLVQSREESKLYGMRYKLCGVHLEMALDELGSFGLDPLHFGTGLVRADLVLLGVVSDALLGRDGQAYA